MDNFNIYKYLYSDLINLLLEYLDFESQINFMKCSKTFLQIIGQSNIWINVIRKNSDYGSTRAKNIDKRIAKKHFSSVCAFYDSNPLFLLESNAPILRVNSYSEFYYLLKYISFKCSKFLNFGNIFLASKKHIAIYLKVFKKTYDVNFTEIKYIQDFITLVQSHKELFWHQCCDKIIIKLNYKSYLRSPILTVNVSNPNLLNTKWVKIPNYISFYDSSKQIDSISYIEKIFCNKITIIGPTLQKSDVIFSSLIYKNLSKKDKQKVFESMKIQLIPLFPEHMMQITNISKFGNSNNNFDCLIPREYLLDDFLEIIAKRISSSKTQLNDLLINICKLIEINSSNF
jgi:hypothetical protein